MSKVATNRTNIRYAHELRRRGFPTAVHALPKNIRDYVDELLEKGFAIRSLANELNKRYGQEIEAVGLKPITRTSLTTYRDKFWHKTPQFKKIVIDGTEATQKASEEVLKDFDAFKEMVKAAKYQKERVRMVKEVDKKMRIPSKRGDEMNLQLFDMAERVLNKAMELGLVEKVPVMVAGTLRSELSLKDGLTDREVILTVKEAIAAIEGTGKYAKREYTGKLTKPAGVADKKRGSEEKSPIVRRNPNTPRDKSLEKNSPKKQFVKDVLAPDEENEFHPSRRKKLL